MPNAVPWTECVGTQLLGRKENALELYLLLDLGMTAKKERKCSNAMLDSVKDNMDYVTSIIKVSIDEE